MNAIADPAAIEAELQRRFAERPISKGRFVMPPVIPPVRCANGFSVSVQASETHYCAPRASAGPYWKLELGYPSQPMPTLARWMEDQGDPSAVTETVWGYVPVHEVAAVLASHGGLVA